MTFETPAYRDESLKEHTNKKRLPGTDHPPCAGCGMPLVIDSGKDDLICRFCGLRHRFLPPLELEDANDIRIGDNVAVEWKGHWWYAHVVDELDDEKKWLVHFVGWAPAFDATVDASRIRTIDYFPGDTIIHPPPDFLPSKASAPKSTLPASSAAIVIMAVLTIIGFAILFLFPQTLNVPVTHFQPDISGIVNGPVSPHASPLGSRVVEGQKLHVKRGDNWYMGKVTRVDEVTNDITVRYTSWGTQYEEIVPVERLRVAK